MEKTLRWIEKYAKHKNANKALALVAFTESSFFPIPPFLFMVAMLAQEKKPSWVKLALIGMVFSVTGGIAAYFVGMFFYGYVGEPIVRFYGIQDEVTTLGTMFKDHVFLTILLASVSPVPYKVFTLSAGLFSVDLPSFIVASIVGRSLRFFAVAYVSNKYGTQAKKILLAQQKRTAYILYFFLGIGAIYLLSKVWGIL